jgi:hypothetical protein
MLRVMTGMHGRLFLLLLTVLLAVGCYSKKDEEDAFKAAERVHSQLQSGDFSSVHREAGPGVKRAMNESSFVEGMRRAYQENGTLRRITPVAYQSGVDAKAGRIHTLLFDLEFERFRVRERLVFTRSQSGKMELWDLIMDRIP